MTPHRRWLALLSGVLTACAHATLPAAAGPVAKADRVIVTGSHIPRRVDQRSGEIQTISPVFVYDRNQLESTGRLYDLGTAMRELDPSVSSGN
jgi:hypothetical protein